MTAATRRRRIRRRVSSSIWMRWFRARRGVTASVYGMDNAALADALQR
jgi:hypothetical protein